MAYISKDIYDKFPRTEVSYCYVCNALMEIERFQGDKARYAVKMRQYCVKNVISTDHLDIVPVICDREACQSVYAKIPRTRYHEEKIVARTGKTFDNGSFLGYPSRIESREIVSDENGRFSINIEYAGDRCHETEPLLQAWLFFGLGHEILGDFFEPAEYTVVEDGIQMLTLEPLVVALERWMPYAAQAGLNTSRNFHRFNSALEAVNDMLKATIGSSFGEDLRIFIASAAELMSRVLHSLYLERREFGALVISWPLSVLQGLLNSGWSSYAIMIPAALLTLLLKYWYPRHEIFGAFTVYWPVSRVQNLIDLGWCPYEANEYSKSLSLLTMRSLIATLDRRGSRAQHTSCSALECIESRRALEDDRGPRHSVSCSQRGCAKIRINEHQMEDICTMLLTDTFPILRIDLAEDASVKALDIVPYNTDLRFVAISHVWAQGLGNEEDNAVFTCQLQKLSSMVESLRNITIQSGEDHTLYLWLDTLCCPVASRGGRRARNAAISLMHQVYDNATHVLALDSEWEHLEVSQTSCPEIAARIFNSSWAWRLWTLQEGAIPRELWFQLKDQPVNAAALFLAIRDSLRSLRIRDRIVAPELLQWFLGVRILSNRYQSLNRHQEIQMVCNTLEKRVVMRPEDEPLCIAVLLDLDSRPILEARDLETRMQRLWDVLSHAGLISRDIAFMCKKSLKIDGYRWAFSTFRQTGVATCFAYFNFNPVYITRNGLEVKGSGTLLELNTALVGFDAQDFESSEETVSPNGYVPAQMQGLPFPQHVVKDFIEHNIMYVQFKPTSWAIVYGLQAFFETMDGLPANETTSLKDVFSRDPKATHHYGLVFKYPGGAFSTGNDGTCMTVELKEQTDGKIVCTQQCLAAFRWMSLEESVCLSFARLHARDLRKHENYSNLKASCQKPSEDPFEKFLQNLHGPISQHLVFDEGLRSREEIPLEIRSHAVDEFRFRKSVIADLAGKTLTVAKQYPDSQVWAFQ